MANSTPIIYRHPFGNAGGHKDDVRSVAFNPDGKWFASGSNCETVNLWGITTPTSAKLATLEVHARVIDSLAFSLDSKQLSTRSAANTVHRWNLDFAFLTAEACLTANRNLTCAEWRQHIGPAIHYCKTCEALPAPQTRK